MAQNLEAAWRLSQRLGDRSSQRQVQQQICLQGAGLGDGELLLTKLQKRHQATMLMDVS